MKLIVGLGNPGRRYASTRHNVGFMVVDELAKRYKIHVKKRIGRALTGQGIIGEDEVLFAKPQTFMNLSGEAVSHLVRRYKINVEDIIVVYDDVDLPLGKIRVRQKGSAGGHKGVKSIIFSLHTQDFPRVRIGIGSIEGEAIDYVLSRFKRSEQTIMKSAVASAASAIETLITQGAEEAMNAFN